MAAMKGAKRQVCVEFGAMKARIVSLLGYLQIRYPEKYVVSFNAGA